MLGELEDQMATILWQVPQQMFAIARAAIYIVVKHRHANICKRTVGRFLLGDKVIMKINRWDETFWASVT